MHYRLIITLGLIIFATSLTNSQVLINEIMASNSDAVYDEDNDTPDWLELINYSSSAVNLNGYRISDVNDFSKAWAFPDTTINALGRIVIFASEKNRTSSDKFIIEASGDGIHPYDYEDGFRFHYLWIKGNFDIQMRVHSLRNTDISGSAGLIMRESFEENSKYAGVFCYYQSEIPFLYRDAIGMVPNRNFSTWKLEYPNGWLRLKRDGDSVYGYAKDKGGMWALIYTYYYPAPDSMLVGIAVSSSNHNMMASAAISDLSLNGNTLNYDILNVANIDSETQGKSYYSREMHTNFKLNSEGESIFIWDAQGNLVDSLSYSELKADISFGRYPDGSDDKEFFSPSTPGQANRQGKPGFAEDPLFSIYAGWYNSQLQLSFENTNPSLQIRYTRDGTNASDTSTLYDGEPIIIDSSTVIRARGFQGGLLPSREIVNTYIINDSSSLPVVSFAVSPKKLWDTIEGIFYNLWPAKETDGNFELFDKMKNIVFTSHTELKVHGGNSRTYAQKSLRLTSKSKYENETFRFPFFGSNYLDEFNEVIFRNSGIDWKDSKLRDAFSSVIAEKIPSQLMSKYRPYVSFMNGKYWGLYDLRERIDEDFLSIKYKIPVESIDMIDQDEYVIAGDVDDFLNMKSSVFNTDMTKPESYILLDSLFDLENFIDYLSVEIFCNNMDWPWNNVKVWKSNVYDGKWRFILHDLDWTFGLWGASANRDLMFEALNPDTSKFTNLFLKILENKKIRERFINRFADLLNSVFIGDRLVPIIDSLAAGIEPELARHFKRWEGDYNEWKNKTIPRIRTFAHDRAEEQRQHIKNYFNLEGIVKVDFNNNLKGSGLIKVNTLDLTAFPWSGFYFKKIPITIKAIPGAGFKFKRWLSNAFIEDSSNPEQTVSLEEDAIIVANFEKSGIADSNIVINEIMYKANDTADTQDWIELYNPNSRVVDLGGWYLMDDETKHKFIFPEGTIIQEKSYYVFSRDTISFIKFYPDIRPVIGNFDFGFGLPDMVRLFNKNSELIDSVYYLALAPWPTDCNGTGKSLELINPILNNVLGESWQSSYELLGTPDRQNSVFVDTPNRYLWKNELFCYPNPFKDKTVISAVSDKSQQAEIEIQDIFGRKIKSIYGSFLSEGENEFIWDGTNDNGISVGGGVYFCILSSNKNKLIFKVIKISN